MEFIERQVHNMKTSKKIILAVVAVLLVAAIALGIAFAVLSRSGVQEIEKPSTPHTQINSNIAYVVGKAPYITDGVFETKNGMESYWLKNRTYGHALEVILQFTKDNEMVVLSGDLDETSNAQLLFGKDASVSSLTLEELKTVNLAYNFKAADGTMPYKAYSSDGLIDQVSVLSLNDFMEYYASPIRSRFILFFSFKDEKAVPDYKAALDQIQTTAETYNVSENSMVFRTDDAQIAAYIDEACPLLNRTATASEANSLYLSSLTGKAQSDLPYAVIFADADSRFATEKFIHYARNLSLGVVLDDPEAEEIATLQGYGVNGIATGDVENYCGILSDAIDAAKAAEKNSSAAAK